MDADKSAESYVKALYHLVMPGTAIVNTAVYLGHGVLNTFIWMKGLLSKLAEISSILV